ncbi:MAG TPA: chorismate mutase [Pyrinomonadaceae bacterium]|jgi:chorismate mutase
MTIEDWRAEINAIDSELLRLLNERARLAVKVGETKKTAGLSVCDREREREVIERASTANEGPLDERAVVKIFRRIIFESKRIEAQAMGLGGTRAETNAR